MALSPLAFTGISSFSDDFQAILDRSVSIASLPARALEKEQAGLMTRKMAAAELRSAVADVAAALRQLGELSRGGALAAASSSWAVQATAGPGAAPGLYRITNLSSLASPAVARSAAGFADTDTTPASDGSGRLELVLDGETREITLGAGADNLAGLRDAINAGGFGLTATILDAGPEAGSNRYYLSITANETGARTLELRRTAGDPGSNLLSVVSAGSNATFELNGIPIVSSSNRITDAIPGVTLELKGTLGDGASAEVSVRPTAAGVASALQGFVKAYNALAEKLDRQSGKNGGPLAGDSIVNDLRAALREITGYRAPGNPGSLFETGISIGSDGVMSFDPAAIQQLSPEQIEAVFALFGDGSSGLSALESRLANYSDPLTGSITALLENIDRTDQRLTEQINAIYERVAATRQTLVARLQAADTLLASLEGQKNMLNAAIESLQTVAFGKRPSQ
jgi:flagellar hook-associated protein 2